VRILKFLAISAILLPAAAQASERSYHCQGKIVATDYSVKDLGRTYPDNDLTPQHTYQITYRAFVLKSGETLLQTVEKTQAYIQNDYRTWKYSFGWNPNGGGFDQPRYSIWLTSNDRDVIQAVYYSNPFNNQKLSCRKL
jgi:hypothetical protein